MSALAVLFRRDGSAAEDRDVAPMLDAQALRGPDARRIATTGPAALGHALLATSPEDAPGVQPVTVAGGAVTLVLDGRLDHREGLAAALGVPHVLVSDAALAATAYLRWGDGFAERLEGDFALALWDARRRALLGARDVMGARPLYFRADPRAFRLASQPLALLAPGEAPAPRFEAMALFLAERYTERGPTLLRAVEAVPPGGLVRVTATSIDLAVSRWPTPVIERALSSPRAHEEALRATLRAAVRSRMRVAAGHAGAREAGAREAGRVAIHLSGGIDSSSIAGLAVAVARDEGAPPPVLLTCAFPGMECDEAEFSGAVASHLGLPLERVTMPGDLADYAPERGRSPRGLLTNPIARMLDRQIDRAKELGIRVALTGTGSDQLLQATGFELAAALLRGDVRAALELSGLREAPLSIEPYRALLRRGVKRLIPARARAAARRALGRGDGLPAWLTPAARRAIREADAEAERAAARDDAVLPRDPAKRRLVTQLRGDADYSFALVLVDQIAAARGGELRHPFMDRRVIELLVSLPNEVRSAGPPDKALLRRAMGDLLPPLVRDREGAAEFSPLLRTALVDAHGERLAGALRRGALAAEGLVDGEAAAAVVERARGDRWVLREVMVLASLELWLRGVREPAPPR